MEIGKTSKAECRTDAEKKNTGVSFEKTVARIQKMMDPKSTVTHNEKLQDRVGNTRQYDVVIRGRFSGRDVLGVIECRDHKRKKGPDAIEAFAKKTENLNANFRLMVSRRGFTEQALRLGKHEGVGCLSLLPRDPQQVGFGIGDIWYGRRYSWHPAFLTVVFADEESQRPDRRYDSRSVTMGGKPILHWFEKEIYTIFGTQTELGEFTFFAEFDCIRNIRIHGVEYQAKAMACTATRRCQQKKKWVTWSGDAFYDWHAGIFTVAPNGIITGSVIDSTLADWNDFDGIIPDEDPDFCRMVLNIFEQYKFADNIVDLQPMIAHAHVVAGPPASWRNPS